VRPRTLMHDGHIDPRRSSCARWAVSFICILALASHISVRMRLLSNGKGAMFASQPPPDRLIEHLLPIGFAAVMKPIVSGIMCSTKRW